MPQDWHFPLFLCTNLILAYSFVICFDWSWSLFTNNFSNFIVINLLCLILNTIDACTILYEYAIKYVCLQSYVCMFWLFTFLFWVICHWLRFCCFVDSLLVVRAYVISSCLDILQCLSFVANARIFLLYLR